MSYLKYANLCAEVVRSSLKEPFLTKARCAEREPTCVPCSRAPRLQAKPRASAFFKATPYEHGKPGKSGACRCSREKRSERG